MSIPNDFNEVKNEYIPENIYVNMYLLNSNSFIYKYVIMRCTVQYSTRRHICRYVSDGQLCRRNNYSYLPKVYSVLPNAQWDIGKTSTPSMTKVTLAESLFHFLVCCSVCVSNYMKWKCFLAKIGITQNDNADYRVMAIAYCTSPYALYVY